MKAIIGRIEIPIERDGEVVGKITFDPDDLGFLDKYYGLIEVLEVKEKELTAKGEALDSNDKKDAYGLPINMKERLAFARELCIFMRGQIDDVFGEGTSQTVFGDYNNPDMFEQFFLEIAPHVQGARGNKVAQHLGNREQRRAAAKGKKVMR